MKTCYCASSCYPGKPRVAKTIASHLQKDRKALARCREHHTARIRHLQQCIEKTERSIQEPEYGGPNSSEMQDLDNNDTTDGDLIDVGTDINATVLPEEYPPIVGMDAHDTRSNTPVGWELVESGGQSASLDAVLESDPLASVAGDETPSPSHSLFSQPLPEGACNDFLSEQWWAGADGDDHVEDVLGEEIDEELELQDGEQIGASTSRENPDIILQPARPVDSDFLRVPEQVQKLREELVGDYKIGPKPTEPPTLPPLSPSETYSLKHYAAWIKSNGTVEAYKEHAAVLEDITDTTILSLDQVKKLAQSLVEFSPRSVDMCPRSCVAYTGKYELLLNCPYKPQNATTPCNEPRYFTTRSGVLKPRAQVQVLPVVPMIRALYANADTSRLMRHRDSSLRQAIHLLGTAATRSYSDYGDSQIHLIQHRDLKLFQDPRDVALALSTDGAQLEMKKQSNTWLLILIILNIPPTIRVQTDYVMINFSTPGPNSPGDIESFVWSVFEEAATGSEGLWIWDAIDSSYFTMRFWIAMGLGDMLGSAKINGMAGHAARHGDRFSLVPGVKASLVKGSKAQYYPLLAPKNPEYNPGNRPDYLALKDIPPRFQQDYLKTLEALENAPTKKDKAKITLATGVSHLPLCLASRAFIHPTFFPLDPFHLLYENCMAFMWDIWTSRSLANELVHLPKDISQLFGEAIPLAMTTLPPAFCGPIRDPHLKRQSQYKIYEWMALLHWYIVPLFYELSVNTIVQSNFACFVQIVEFSMTVKPRNDKELDEFGDLIMRFLHGYQRLYISNNLERLSRARLCLFQLVHIPNHIRWYGSIRIGSQATVERSIGEMGHKIRSKKAPFSNLTNIIYHRELFKILSLYYPQLGRRSRNPLQIPDDPDTTSNIKFRQEHRIAWTRIKHDPIIQQEIEAVSDFLGIDLPQVRKDETQAISVRRWGKLRLENQRVVASRLSRTISQPARKSEWFEAAAESTSESFNLIFGEAWAFYQIELCSKSHSLVVYTPLAQVERLFHVPFGQWEQGRPKVMDISRIHDLIGIWEGTRSKRIYILRKHPALDFLSVEGRGFDTENGSEQAELE